MTIQNEFWGGWVRQRCLVSFGLGFPTDIGLQLGKACSACTVEDACFYFLCLFTIISLAPQSPLSLTFLSFNISSIPFLLSL